MKLHYITGNQSKFDNAAKFLSSKGVSITQTKLGLDEIQAKDGVDVARTKVRQAFERIHEPLFINDASWEIPALHGFPGPFMKYVSQWLSNQDMLALMRNKTDRSIILIDVIAYKDAHEEKIFVFNTSGTILRQPIGDISGPEITKIISLSDDGASLASVRSQGFTEKEKLAWSEFAAWVRDRDTAG